MSPICLHAAKKLTGISVTNNCVSLLQAWIESVERESEVVDFKSKQCIYQTEKGTEGWSSEF
jgi:hypothetical protein